MGPLIHGTAEGDRENRNRELRSAMHSISAEKGMYSVAQPSLPYSSLCKTRLGKTRPAEPLRSWRASGELNTRQTAVSTGSSSAPEAAGNS